MAWIYRPASFSRVFATELCKYESINTRRLTDKQIEAAARRFMADGETQNTLELLALRRHG